MTDYRPLSDFLSSRPSKEVSLGFEDLERILGQSLPASARKHQAFWANTTTHSYASSWMSVGWRTAKLNLAEESVTFRREQDEPALAGSPDPKTGAIVIPRSALSPGTLRMIADYSEVLGVDEAAAIVRIVEDAALDRRRQLLARFAEMSPRIQGDSSELIREDRDAR